MALEDYTPQTDFSQDEANQVSGRSTVRTTNLDAEFANLQTSIASLIARLQAISRDDDALQDGIVTYESISAEVVTLLGSAGFNVRGVWLTTTAYAIGDMVSNGTGTYVCAEAHTSGTFATDLAAGKWVLIFDSATFSAADVSFTPTGGVSATDVQAAIAEVDLEKMAKAANGSDISNAATFRSNISVPSKAEVQNQTHTYAADTGTSDALVITLSPAPAAYATGLRAAVKKSASASSSTAPTLDANALGAKVIYARGGQALVAGDMPAGAHIDLEYDAALNGGVGGWELMNPAAETGLSSVVAFSGFLTPSTLTADQNDYNPTGLSAASTLRISSNAARQITGLAGGSRGRALFLHNVGAYTITLPAESASSAVANRFASGITIDAGDSALIEYDDTSARWRAVALPVNIPTSGKVRQIVFAHKTDTFSTASTSFTDLTGLSVSLTPTNAANKVLILAAIMSGNSANNYNHYQALRDSTVIVQGDTAGSRVRTTVTATPNAAFSQTPGVVMAVDSPGDTSAHTYKIQMAVGGGTGYVNRSGTDTDSATYSRAMSSIIAVEYEP